MNNPFIFLCSIVFLNIYILGCNLEDKNRIEKGGGVVIHHTMYTSEGEPEVILEESLSLPPRGNATYSYRYTAPYEGKFQLYLKYEHRKISLPPAGTKVFCEGKSLKRQRPHILNEVMRKESYDSSGKLTRRGQNTLQFQRKLDQRRCEKEYQYGSISINVNSTDNSFSKLSKNGGMGYTSEKFGFSLVEVNGDFGLIKKGTNLNIEVKTLLDKNRTYMIPSNEYQLVLIFTKRRK